jgi:hypothetical protein
MNPPVRVTESVTGLPTVMAVDERAGVIDGDALITVSKAQPPVAPLLLMSPL